METWLNQTDGLAPRRRVVSHPTRASLCHVEASGTVGETQGDKRRLQFGPDPQVPKGNKIW